MKMIYTVLFLAALGAGGWWLWESNSQLSTVVGQYIDNGEIQTLQARYTVEKVMEQHEKELLGDGERSYHKSELKFHPYAMMDVKYSAPDRKTKEGVILWGLVDGEMVVNCETWEKTHGFEDTINASANRNDFKVLNALAKNKGKLSMESLQSELQVEQDVLQPWLESVKQKHLVVQKGNDVQLHFQNPKLFVTPQSKISECLVTKPFSHAQKISRRYSTSQIEKIALAAFGQDFTIRTTKEVFLPVYSIEIMNPDGSILTTYWNAVNGKRITPHYLSQVE